MSKILTLADGSEITISDASSILDVEVAYGTSAEMAADFDKFTVENLKSGTINSDAFENIIPVSMSAVKEDDVITVHFYNREMTDIEKLYAAQALLAVEQEVQNEAIDDLIMQSYEEEVVSEEATEEGV